MQRFDYDLSGSMGTYLRSVVSFDCLKKIQHAYTCAFGKAFVDSFPSTDIFHTEQIRHLIAHRAGLIDQKFKDETKSFGLYDDQPIGSRIVLTGPSVRERINACIQCGTKILRDVDAWSVVHTE